MTARRGRTLGRGPAGRQGRAGKPAKTQVAIGIPMRMILLPPVAGARPVADVFTWPTCPLARAGFELKKLCIPQFEVRTSPGTGSGVPRPLKTNFLCRPVNKFRANPFALYRNQYEKEIDFTAVGRRRDDRFDFGCRWLLDIFKCPGKHAVWR